MTLKYVRKIILAIIAVIISILVIFVSFNLFVFSTSYVCDDAYLASYLDKRDLLMTVPAPRIILLGDSTFAHSVDSVRLSEAFDMPVVNTGIYGSMGIYYWMTMVEQHIQEGDIVLITSSHKQWIDHRQTGLHFFGYKRKTSAWLLALLDLSSIRNITHPEQIQLFLQGQADAVTARVENGFFETSQCIDDVGVKFRQQFNEYGDFVGHLDEANPNKDFGIVMEGMPIDEEIFTLTNEVTSRMSAKGATVYFIPPPLAESAYLTNQSLIDNFLPSMRDGLNFAVLGESRTFVYPDSLMHDTEYHTNREGRELYTADIIDLLETNVDSFQSSND